MNIIKLILLRVSVIPIDDLSNICINISASSRDTKLYCMV